MKQNELLEKKELREKVIGKIEVLDKVGDLLLLPNTEYATTEQVADYYQVGKDVIRQIKVRNSDELESDGVCNKSNKEIKTIVNCDNMSLLKIPPRGTLLFPKRAILRVGMLLRDSEVAKEIRTRLLDIIHDTEKENPETIKNIVNEITEEKQLMLDRVEAEMKGDYDTVSIINAKLFGLKNKRIKELEEQNKIITTHALTIMQSRDVINRLVRSIAMRSYSGNFGRSYNELYSKINYKLGINIKSRKRNKGESYLHTLTEEETFKVEEIVRNWAVKVGLDVDSLLKIA